jgi:hypothetical protein
MLRGWGTEDAAAFKAAAVYGKAGGAPVIVSLARRGQVKTAALKKREGA